MGAPPAGRRKSNVADFVRDSTTWSDPKPQTGEDMIKEIAKELSARALGNALAAVQGDAPAAAVTSVSQSATEAISSVLQIGVNQTITHDRIWKESLTQGSEARSRVKAIVLLQKHVRRVINHWKVMRKEMENMERD